MASIRYIYSFIFCALLLYCGYVRRVEFLVYAFILHATSLSNQWRWHKNIHCALQEYTFTLIHKHIIMMKGMYKVEWKYIKKTHKNWSHCDKRRGKKRKKHDVKEWSINEKWFLKTYPHTNKRTHTFALCATLIIYVNHIINFNRQFLDHTKFHILFQIS